MRLRGRLVLILAALAWGCRSPAIRPAAEMPVEQAPQGEGITSEEKETLVALARDTLPGRGIRSICLDSRHHPNDLPVATVHLEPFKLDAERYEFVTLTVRNRNWRHYYDKNPQRAVFPPETCWYLDEKSRWSKIKHRFRYRKEFIFLSVPKENTHQDIEEIVHMFERGKAKAVDKNGKTMEVLSGHTDAIRRYAKDGSVFVEVSYSQHLSGGTYEFELVGNTLVLRHGTFWVS